MIMAKAASKRSAVTTTAKVSFEEAVSRSKTATTSPGFSCKDLLGFFCGVNDVAILQFCHAGAIISAQFVCAAGCMLNQFCALLIYQMNARCSVMRSGSFFGASLYLTATGISARAHLSVNIVNIYGLNFIFDEIFPSFFFFGSKIELGMNIDIRRSIHIIIPVVQNNLDFCG